MQPAGCARDLAIGTHRLAAQGLRFEPVGLERVYAAEPRQQAPAFEGRHAIREHRYVGRVREQPAERVGRQVAVEHQRGRVAQPGGMALQPLGRDVLEYRHVVYRGGHVAIRPVQRQVGRGGLAAQHLAAAHVDTGVARALEQAATKKVVPHHTEQTHDQPEPREVFGHVARHAAGRATDAPGNRVAGRQHVLGAAGDVHVGGADGHHKLPLGPRVLVVQDTTLLHQLHDFGHTNKSWSSINLGVAVPGPKSANSTALAMTGYCAHAKMVERGCRGH